MCRPASAASSCGLTASHVVLSVSQGLVHKLVHTPGPHQHLITGDPSAIRPLTDETVRRGNTRVSPVHLGGKREEFSGQSESRHDVDGSLECDASDNLLAQTIRESVLASAAVE
jgi:hypothetical protein